MEWQRRWINAFARLVYVVERGKKTVIALRAQEAQEKRRQLAQQTSLAGSAQVCRCFLDTLGVMGPAPAGPGLFHDVCDIVPKRSA